MVVASLRDCWARGSRPAGQELGAALSSALTLEGRQCGGGEEGGGGEGRKGRWAGDEGKRRQTDQQLDPADSAKSQNKICLKKKK